VEVAILSIQSARTQVDNKGPERPPEATFVIPCLAYGAHTPYAQSLVPNKPFNKLKDAWPHEETMVQSLKIKGWGTPN